MRFLLHTLIASMAFTPGCNEPYGGCGVKENPADAGLLLGIPAQPDAFKANCASCHFYDKPMTGPAVRGFVSRAPYPGWVDLFLSNEDSLLAANDTFAIRINGQWLLPEFNHHFRLTQQEMQDLRMYLH